MIIEYWVWSVEYGKVCVCVCVCVRVCVCACSPVARSMYLMRRAESPRWQCKETRARSQGVESEAPLLLLLLLLWLLLLWLLNWLVFLVWGRCLFGSIFPSFPCPLFSTTSKVADRWPPLPVTSPILTLTDGGVLQWSRTSALVTCHSCRVGVRGWV